jgi:hypothetical protein
MTQACRRLKPLNHQRCKFLQTPSENGLKPAVTQISNYLTCQPLVVVCNNAFSNCDNGCGRG